MRSLAREPAREAERDLLQQPPFELPSEPRALFFGFQQQAPLAPSLDERTLKPLKVLRSLYPNPDPNPDPNPLAAQADARAAAAGHEQLQPVRRHELQGPQVFELHEGALQAFFQTSFKARFANERLDLGRKRPDVRGHLEEPRLQRLLLRVGLDQQRVHAIVQERLAHHGSAALDDGTDAGPRFECEDLERGAGRALEQGQRRRGEPHKRQREQNHERV